MIRKIKDKTYFNRCFWVGISGGTIWFNLRDAYRVFESVRERFPKEPAQLVCFDLTEKIS